MEKVMKKEKDLGRAKGGHARAAALTPGKRTEIAKKAAEARWRKPPMKFSDIKQLTGMEKLVLTEAIALLSDDRPGPIDRPGVPWEELGSAIAKLNHLLSLVERPEPADIRKPRVKAKWVCDRCSQAMRGPGLHLSIDDCLRWLVQRFDAALKG